MSRGAERQVRTEVPGQPVAPNSKDQAVQEEFRQHLSMSYLSAYFSGVLKRKLYRNREFLWQRSTKCVSETPSRVIVQNDNLQKLKKLWFANKNIHQKTSLQTREFSTIWLFENDVPCLTSLIYITAFSFVTEYRTYNISKANCFRRQVKPQS
jgi:hypothetical protein